MILLHLNSFNVYTTIIMSLPFKLPDVCAKIRGKSDSDQECIRALEKIKNNTVCSQNKEYCEFLSKNIDAINTDKNNKNVTESKATNRPVSNAPIVNNQKIQTKDDQSNERRATGK